MKICFISPKSYPLFNPKVRATFGGAEVQIYLLAKEIAKYKGFDVSILVADYGQGDIEDIKKVKLIKSLDFKSNLIKKIISVYRSILKSNADIYVQRTLTIFSGVIALVLKIKKKKFIYMVAHDSEVDGTHRLHRNKIKFFISNLVFKYSTLVVLQNDYQYKKLKSKRIKSVTIRSGKVIRSVSKNKGEYILWVGRSEYWKRPELFLKLADRLPDRNFVMICPPSTNSPSLSKSIKKLASTKQNVKFIPYIPYKDIGKYFKKAKIFVCTSKKEGFPSTYLDAAKYGTPVLSIKVNPDSFITNYKCGFVCNDDVDVMVDKLRILLEDKKLYETFSNNTYLYAKKNHDIKEKSRDFIDVIKKITK